MERSAQVSRSRPFYSQYADVYDLLVVDPVEPWVETVTARVPRASADAEVLDAGCGTGRHAAAFVARGFAVTLADASPDLLAAARRRCPTIPARLVDLCTMTAPPRYDVVTCRGVLNDLTTDAERDAALRAMTRALRPGGWLFCDVREATASALRADGSPRVRRVGLPSGGELSFTSTSRWSDGLLHVREQHLVSNDEGRQQSDYTFVMRPWTHEEIRTRFAEAGLAQVEIEPGIGRATPDHLTIMARPGGPRARSAARDEHSVPQPAARSE